MTRFATAAVAVLVTTMAMKRLRTALGFQTGECCMPICAPNTRGVAMKCNEIATGYACISYTFFAKIRACGAKCGGLFRRTPTKFLEYRESIGRKRSEVAKMTKTTRFCWCVHVAARMKIEKDLVREQREAEEELVVCMNKRLVKEVGCTTT